MLANAFGRQHAPQPTPTVEEQLASAGEPYHLIYPCGGHCGLITRKSFFYMRAYSRRFATLDALERLGDEARATPGALPDLLMHFLLNIAPGSATAARRHIDLELEALAPVGAARLVLSHVSEWAKSRTQRDGEPP